MSNIGVKSPATELMLAQLRDMQAQARPSPEKNLNSSSGGASFMDHLTSGIKQVDGMQKDADQMATNLASGKEQNIHETMLAATQAELSFNLMVQIRNRVLEAYQEVMRMPV